jgi:hypothetical protein
MAEFASLRVTASPLLGLGSARGWWSQNANEGAGGLQSDREKLKKTKERRMDICNFK